MMRIFLTGMMGSGKTSVGKKLAKHMSLDFIDVDQYIEKKEGKSIADFFQSQDQEAFRKIEHDYFLKIIEKDNIIISTGGGLPYFYNNMDIILQSGISVYLRANVAFLKSRLLANKKSRPLIANVCNNDLEPFLSRMLKQREQCYQKSNIEIPAINADIKKIAEKINSF